MEPSTFISEFNRVLRRLDPINLEALRSREPACIRALVACRKNSRADVRNALEPYANRQITEDAEWVYDDFLLFAFLCAVIQFGEFKGTVEKLAAFRRRSEQGRKFTFLQDAERIAQSAAFAPNSMFTVVVADFLEKTVTDSGALRAAHREAVQANHDGRITAFEDTIARRCQEVVAEMSIDSSMSSSIVARHLWQRCRAVATIVYWLAIAAIAAGTAWLVWLYFFGSDKSSNWAEKMIAVGASGVLAWAYGGRRKGSTGLAYAFVWLLAGSKGRTAMIALNDGVSTKKSAEGS